MTSIFLVGIQMVTLGLLVITGPAIPNNRFSVILMIFGFLIELLSVYAMRRSKLRISPHISQGSRLVTQGIYGFIRHPMYLGVFMVALGLLINSVTLIRLCLFFVLIIDLIWKSQYEELLLESHFSEYKEYKAKTFKFIPFIY